MKIKIYKDILDRCALIDNKYYLIDAMHIESIDETEWESGWRQFFYKDHSYPEKIQALIQCGIDPKVVLNKMEKPIK